MTAGCDAFLIAEKSRERNQGGARMQSRRSKTVESSARPVPAPAFVP